MDTKKLLGISKITSKYTLNINEWRNFFISNPKKSYENREISKSEFIKILNIGKQFLENCYNSKEHDLSSVDYVRCHQIIEREIWLVERLNKYSSSSPQKKIESKTISNNNSSNHYERDERDLYDKIAPVVVWSVIGAILIILAVKYWSAILAFLYILFLFLFFWYGSGADHSDGPGSDY